MSQIVFLLSLFISPPSLRESQEALAVKTTLKDLKWLDNATAQWAIEHGKAETDAPRWEDLAEYLLPESELFLRKGLDVLGNRFTLGPVRSGPTLSPKSVDAFKTVTGDGKTAHSYWGKYFPKAAL